MTNKAVTRSVTIASISKANFKIANCHRQEDILKQGYQPVNNVRQTPPEISITRQLATSVGASGNHNNRTGQRSHLKRKPQTGLMAGKRKNDHKTKNKKVATRNNMSLSSEEEGTKKPEIKRMFSNILTELKTLKEQNETFRNETKMTLKN